jgi:hypothetical protein
MSYLNNAAVRRRLVLFCVRLLLQCAMASSIPQTGVDECEARCARASIGPSSQPIARRERTLAALQSAADPGCNYL